MTLLRILRNAEQAAIVLQPSRLRILRALREPLSASALARSFALPRRQLNCHLRKLEKAGYAVFVEERRKGNCIERVMQATAKTFVISPEALGDADPMPVDQFSAAYLVSAASRITGDVAQIALRARTAGKKLAIFTLEGEVRYRSPAERSAFAAEMTLALARICSKYNTPDVSGARTFHFVLGGYLAITKPLPPSETVAAVLD